MEKVDIIIIGGGVVGLAVAAELTKKHIGSSIVLMERHGKFGQETSSRNSEVIHAGIYYPAGSLKAKLCVEGNHLLYSFCREWNIPHLKLGKLIVARSEEEIPSLESILYQGRENGAQDLATLDRAQVSRLEPHVRASAAIFSPSTGIVDSHSLMSRLEWLAKKGGVIFAYHHEVIGVEARAGGYQVDYRGPDGSADSIQTEWLINCAGLSADRIISLLGINADEAGCRVYPCKGEYFAVSNSKAGMVSHLIYPPPLKELRGLGIHATKTLDGRLRLGPNAFYVNDLDYDINSDRAAEFYSAAKTYLPFLELEDIQPDMAGIRPKIQGPGEAFKDFVVRHESGRGFEGLVNLAGIESPGLTSCLSLAREVGKIVGG